MRKKALLVTDGGMQCLLRWITVWALPMRPADRSPLPSHSLR